MPRTVSITQPTFLPWAGYFDLIAKADIFVVLDIVQFEKQSWQSRNRLLSSNGDIMWLSVPTKKAPLETPIHEIEVSPLPGNWRKKQGRSARESLGKAPYFSEIEPLLTLVYDTEHSHLADLNLSFIRAVCAMLEIQTEIVRARDLEVSGNKVDLLLDICQTVGASSYYSNAGSAVYLETERPRFTDIGVDVSFQEWEHPVYSQRGSHPFVSHLAVLDAIAGMGTEALRQHFTESS